MKLKKMKNIKTLILFLITGIFLTTNSNSENFFAEAKKKYDEKNFEKSKFLFQRNLVYNPKDAKSYLYLAKIFANEENEIVQIKNINTTLLLEPDNEEAMYMLIDMKLEKSDIQMVEELREKFKIICNSLCSKIESIEERLSNIDVSNGS